MAPATTAPLASLTVPVAAEAAVQPQGIYVGKCPPFTGDYFVFSDPHMHRPPVCAANRGEADGLDYTGFLRWKSGNNAGVFNIAKPDGSGVAQVFNKNEGGDLDPRDRIINIRIN